MVSVGQVSRCDLAGSSALGYGVSRTTVIKEMCFHLKVLLGRTRFQAHSHGHWQIQFFAVLELRASDPHSLMARSSSQFLAMRASIG